MFIVVSIFLYLRLTSREFWFVSIFLPRWFDCKFWRFRRIPNFQKFKVEYHIRVLKSIAWQYSRFDNFYRFSFGIQYVYCFRFYYFSLRLINKQSLILWVSQPKEIFLQDKSDIFLTELSWRVIRTQLHTSCSDHSFIANKTILINRTIIIAWIKVFLHRKLFISNRK